MTRFPYNLFKSEIEIDRQIERDERRTEMLRDEADFQECLRIIKPKEISNGQKHDNHTPPARTAQ